MTEFQDKLIEFLHKNVQIEREHIFSFKSDSMLKSNLLFGGIKSQ